MCVFLLKALSRFSRQAGVMAAAQVLDTDKSNRLSAQEFTAAFRKLVSIQFLNEEGHVRALVTVYKQGMNTSGQSNKRCTCMRSVGARRSSNETQSQCWNTDSDSQS
jgi:hypothetical protein